MKKIDKRFAMISPLDYRYIPRDKKLMRWLKRYNRQLNVYEKIKRIIPDEVIPRLFSLEEQLMKISIENSDKKIPRRVDLQQEGETTVGKIFRGYAKRLNRRTLGFISTHTGFADLEEAARNEALADLYYLIASTFSVEANIGNDIRGHYRSEISEMGKDYQVNIIGSSTMPHKVNPYEFENVVSMWKTFIPRVSSAVMAQVTEHQGDSTNAFLPDMTYEALGALCYETKWLEDALKDLKIKV